MSHRFWTALAAMIVLLIPLRTHARQTVGPAAARVASTPDQCRPDREAGNTKPDCPRLSDPPPPRKRTRLFPLAAQAAIDRGYRIPEPWGIGVLAVHNKSRFNATELAATVAKGQAPPADAELLPLPAVTAERLKGNTDLISAKADLWLLPGVNLFASIGKVTGRNKIDVAIDLDAVIPRPFCRPAKPCGTIALPIDTKVDNTTITVGTLLVYGNDRWFILGSIAKTVSISSKDRSDISSTNLGARAGPRFHLGGDAYVAPYLGVNYFDLETTVRGVVASGPFFEDGDAVNLRYRVEMSASRPWAGVAGMSIEVNRHLWLQGEVQSGARSTRLIFSTTARF